MNVVAGFFKSSLGKKYIMALTGILLFIFVVGHMLGNLQIFVGPESINRYGSFGTTVTLKVVSVSNAISSFVPPTWIVCLPTLSGFRSR